jgi:vancomycin resistance protein YoaR
VDGNDQRSASHRADDAGVPTEPPPATDPARSDTAGSDDGATTDTGDAAPPATAKAATAPASPTTAPAAPETRAEAGAPTEGAGAHDGAPAVTAAPAAPPKIFDLPDQPAATRGNGGQDNGGNGTIVLGGAAAAEGRTTGPNPRIAGPAPGPSRVAPPGGEDDAEPTAERGRHFSPAAASEWLRSPLMLAAIPVLVVVLLVVGWAVDTAALSGQVMRNVEVAGREVGGLGEASLPEVMEEVNAELAARPVTVTSGDAVYETTAGDLGLAVDTEATTEAALDAGRRDSLLTRPLSWLTSFFSPREVDVEYAVTQAQVVLKMTELQGTDIVGAQDPGIQVGPEGWTAVPGTPGEGIDPEQVAADLPGAAAANPTGTIEVEAERVPIAPQFTDEEAQALAERANAMTANGITLTAGETSRTVPAEQLRTWITPTTEGGELDLAILPDVVGPAVAQVFADLKADPVNASFDLQGGTPVVIPSQPGVSCCGEDSADLVWQALSDGKAEAALEATVVEPELTTEAAEGLGIVAPVGGNNAWQSGAPTTAGPGFTTYHDCCAARVTNIHRMADIVRGTVVLPGETFSINEVVGQRTAANGFVLAGAIAQGEHRDEIGGGVSQFATTTFNAAYFAGLDIPVYQAHSEYFSRYPLGREATMGFPNPDLQFTNNTPYGIMVWTSYTDTSLTVTLYSTPHATGAQTGISESKEGQCRIVTTTRTRTWPDGHTENDTFQARYRPGPNLNCDGKPINPNPAPG